MRHIVHINPDGSIGGMTALSAWPDGTPYPTPRPDQHNVDVDPDHPVLVEPTRHWRHDGTMLVRKSPADITESDQVEALRRRRPVRSTDEVLLEMINELRQAAGQPAVTNEDIQARRMQERVSPR